MWVARSSLCIKVMLEMIRIIIPMLFSSLDIISGWNGQAEWRLNGHSISVNLFSLHVFLRNRLKVCGAARCSVNLEHCNPRLFRKWLSKILNSISLKRIICLFKKIILLNIYEQIFFQQIFFFPVQISRFQYC